MLKLLHFYSGSRIEVHDIVLLFIDRYGRYVAAAAVSERHEAAGCRGAAWALGTSYIVTGG